MELETHRTITRVAFAGWTKSEISKALDGVTRIDTFAGDQLNKAVNFLRVGQREEAAGALGEGLHSIQDKWAHSFLSKDARGNLVPRQVGWWEHLGRGLLGKVEKFFTGKDTFSPDSPDSANFAERYDRAQQESNAYVKAAEATASQKPANE